MRVWYAYLCLSSRITLAPRSRRVCAAERPARPPPTTMTWAIVNVLCAVWNDGEETKSVRAVARDNEGYMGIW